MSASQAVFADVPGVGVAVASGVGVAVGEEFGVGLASETFVPVGEGGEAVAVDGGDVGEMGPAVGLVARVIEGVAGAVPVAGSNVGVWDGETHIKIKARISKKTATINLNRS